MKDISQYIMGIYPFSFDSPGIEVTNSRDNVCTNMPLFMFNHRWNIQSNKTTTIWSSVSLVNVLQQENNIIYYLLLMITRYHESKSMYIIGRRHAFTRRVESMSKRKENMQNVAYHNNSSFTFMLPADY